jgi:hypothetical protein
MDNKGKRKSFTVSDKINISVQVDAHIESHVELASRLRLSVFSVGVSKETERRYVHCEPFLQVAEITQMFATGEIGI